MKRNDEDVPDHLPEDCTFCGGSGFIILYDYDGPGLHDEDNCYCECHGWVAESGLMR